MSSDLISNKFCQRVSSFPCHIVYQRATARRSSTHTVHLRLHERGESGGWGMDELGGTKL